MADVLYTNVGGILVAEDRGGVYSNYLSDTLGSVRKIFSGGASAVTDTFTYWPYGEEFSRTGTNPTPFTWVGTLGYFRDAAKRFYVRMRSYLADVGSWMSVDPLWPGERAYGYVGGRAVDNEDAAGLFSGSGTLPQTIPALIALLLLLKGYLAAILLGALIALLATVTWLCICFVMAKSYHFPCDGVPGCGGKKFRGFAGCLDAIFRLAASIACALMRSITTSLCPDFSKSGKNHTEAEKQAWNKVAGCVRSVGKSCFMFPGVYRLLNYIRNLLA